jgi:ribose/xylose/arabinose/galactoside ABC-type transport system permease subunit
MGAVAGLINGILITKVRIAPFIVTLGVYSILRGVARHLGRIVAALGQLADDIDDLVEVLFIGCERADGHSPLPLELRRISPP